MSILPALLYLAVINTNIAVEPKELLYSDCQIKKVIGTELQGCYRYADNMILIASDGYWGFDKTFLHEFAHAYAYRTNTQQFYSGYGFKDEEEMANSYITYYNGEKNQRYLYFEKYFPLFK